MAKEFKGEINLDIRDSKPDWSPYLASRAPEGAPNVLIILYDDTGLAAWSPFGGRIEMPTMDRLAENGLRYSQWHTTALCGPTRSCFLTGRNHHENGFATIAESATGFPSNNTHIPMENAFQAEVLRENGWATYWIGKNHNVPVDEFDMGSSKRNWPLARGFDRFYGFIGGETNNWYPSLAEDNRYIDQPYMPEEGYHLSKDLADKALEMIQTGKQSQPDKPWYMFFCPGANHAPHHAPQEFIDKYKGKFDDGYEAYREWVLPRMIERGVMPEGTQLSPINPMPEEVAAPGDHVRPWDSHSADEKRLFSRMAEVYAGFSEYTDHQVGRLIDYLEESGQLDNTLIFYAADNGASGEGSPNGDDRQARHSRDVQPLPDRMGDGLLDALPDVQALQLPGWRLRPAGHPLAEGNPGEGRGALAVPPVHGHRADDLRVLRDRAAGHSARLRAEPDLRHVDEVQLRPPRRPDHQDDAVLRDARNARHLAQRLEGRGGARADALEQGQLRQGPLAALPHRRGPCRGGRSRGRAPRQGQGAGRPVVRGGR
jgi:arylsulfatase A-like enzyme